MTDVRVAAIVEGHGECEAVPVLIRRIAAMIDPGFVPTVLQPMRVPASRLSEKGSWNVPSSLPHAGSRVRVASW